MGRGGGGGGGGSGGEKEVGVGRQFVAIVLQVVVQSEWALDEAVETGVAQVVVQQLLEPQSEGPWEEQLAMVVALVGLQK